MQMTLSKLAAIFPVEIPRPAYKAEDMLKYNQGSEPLSEIKHYWQLTWQEIDVQILDYHSAAFFFISDVFYAYFLPSIIHCSYKNPRDVIDVTTIILNDIIDPHRKRYQDVYLDILNQEQRTAIKVWLDFITPCMEEFGDSEELILAKSAL